MHVPDGIGDEEATLIVTAGTAMYALDTLGGLIAGQSLVVTGPGAIGLLTVAVAKALGAQPVILTGTRESRLELGRKLGADHLINVRNGESGRGGEAHHPRQGRALPRRMLRTTRTA